MNWHQLIDERNFEFDQVIVSVLRRDPLELRRAERWIQQRLADPDYSNHSKDALKEWLDVIKARGLGGVIEVLEDRGEEATRMRQNSPFAILMPQEERMKILRHYEALRTRTYPASV